MKDIDAVLIATPDVTHPRILMDAVAAGKGVCVERPYFLLRRLTGLADCQNVC